MASLRNISNTCVLQTVRAAARRVTQQYEEALKPVELTASQFSVLVAIGLAESIALSALAEYVGMDRTTMARVLKPLERRKLVVIAPSEHDARTRLVSLTRTGHTTLKDAQSLWDKAQKRALRQLGPEWPEASECLKSLGKQ